MDTLPPAQSPSVQALEFGCQTVKLLFRARSLEQLGEKKISSTVHRRKVKNASRRACIQTLLSSVVRIIMSYPYNEIGCCV
jgi:hypothetical protein